MHSNWEVQIANWLIEHNINWSRPIKTLTWYDDMNTKRRYTPDFFIPSLNLYVDVKNPLKIKQDKRKIEILMSIYNLLIDDLINTKSKLARLAVVEPACVQLAFSGLENRRHTDA